MSPAQDYDRPMQNITASASLVQQDLAARACTLCDFGGHRARARTLCQNKRPNLQAGCSSQERCDYSARVLPDRCLSSKLDRFSERHGLIAVLY